MHGRRIYRNAAGLQAGSCLLLLVLCSCVRQSAHPADEGARQRYLAARTLYSEQKLDSALRLLSGIRREDACAAEGLLLAGKICYFRDEPARAMGFWQRSLEADPCQVDARKWLARLLLERREVERADALLLEALSVSSEDPELLILLGKVKWAEGEAAAAIGLFRTAGLFRERLAEASLELARIYRGYGLYEQAAGALQEARLLLPEDSTLLLSLDAMLESVPRPESGGMRR